MRILVTGADGFVGRACCAHLVRNGVQVVAAVRRIRSDHPVADPIEVGDIGTHTDWSRVLDGVDAVIHLVAATHGHDAGAPRALPRYEALNVEATAALAEQSRAHGVRRFVFVSSIKVNGEASLAPADTVVPYGPDLPPRPQDNYGRSKWAAEQRLLALARGGGFEPVILRPPLIYGPGNKGNLLRLMRWIQAGRPLPCVAPANRRSLLYVDNLALALRRAASLPDLGGRVFTLADVHLSTAELVRAMAKALRVAPRLLACPVPLWRALSVLPRGRALRERLCGSLLVDASAATAALDWAPLIPFDAAMDETAAWFLASKPR